MAEIQIRYLQGFQFNVSSQCKYNIENSVHQDKKVL